MNEFRKFREQLQNHMAVSFEQELFSPLAGRIFSLLLFSPEPLSLQQLTESIGVSKAAVSVQVRLLEKLGLCTRTSKANDRKNYYELNEDFGKKFLSMVLGKMKKSLTDLDSFLRNLEQISGVTKEELPAYEAGKKRLEELRTLQWMVWERLSDLEFKR